MPDFNQTLAYIHALTGDVNTVMDWRAIHDTDKGRQAQNFRGKLSDLSSVLQQWNDAGYGIFAMVNETDGRGAFNTNVIAVRSQFADLDNDATALRRASLWSVRPTFAVNTSPGKFHVHWIGRHTDAALYEDIQRRLVTAFNADHRCIDLARVLRVPGFQHRKGDPFPVTCFAISGVGVDARILKTTLAGVQPFQGVGGVGNRKPLGTPSLAAPSLELVVTAFNNIDPNELLRDEWISLTAAFKQAMWTLTDENTAYNLWCQWCNRYTKNDPRENAKQWNSIRDTERGWAGIVARAGLAPYLKLNGVGYNNGQAVPDGGSANAGIANTITANAGIANTTTINGAETVTLSPGGSSDYLDANQQMQYFAGCVYIQNEGKIRTRDGLEFGTDKFNATFGGPRFAFTIDGKTTPEAWAACTRNQLWRIPTVHFTRFLPKFEPGAVIKDEFGRLNYNTYMHPTIDAVEGDITPFHNHMAALVPNAKDRDIILDHMTHTIQKIGVKIPWAPVIQSAEGAGKEAFKIIMTHALARDYVYTPKTEQLADSGGKFNAWMENRLYIFANEIRVGEKFHLMEVLKPLIEQEEIEIEGKAVNQKKGDNPANWMMFTNYQDAIVVNENSRRYAIIYSALQTYQDILNAGMDDAYFTKFYSWLKSDGKRYVTYWLQRRPLSEHFQFARAPRTSSMSAAVAISKSNLQGIVEGAIAAGLPGFRKGWISTKAVVAIAGEAGIKAETKQISATLSQMHYYKIGQVWQGVDRGSTLWHKNPNTQTTHFYAPDQFLDGETVSAGIYNHLNERRQ